VHRIASQPQKNGDKILRGRFFGIMVRQILVKNIFAEIRTKTD